MRRSITLFLTVVVSLNLALMISCQVPPENNEPQSEPIELYLDKAVDTALVLYGDDYAVNVVGVFVNESQTTVRNSGVLADTSYYIYSLDTVHSEMNASKVDWHSSNTTILEVHDGVATGKAAGTAEVWASYKTIVSDTLVFLVGKADQAPELILDPPLHQLVFQDSGYVSGRLLPGPDITLTVAADTVAYSGDGAFGHWAGLQTGVNPIQVVAVNNENGLSTTRQKTFVYYTFASSGIAGHWTGTTLTRPFGFDIYELAGNYIIDGTMIIDATMIGGPMVIRDIVIAGLIHPDGTIDATLSKAWEGFSLTGYMKGYFNDAGHSRGTYGFKIERDGWPTVSGSANWTAEKD